MTQSLHDAPHRHRPPFRLTPIWPFALALAAWAMFDASGFLYSAPGFNTSRTYDVLSVGSWGMRPWGVALMLVALSVAYGAGRERSGRPRPLNLALAVGVFYWIFWAFALAYVWKTLGEVPSWPAMGKALALPVFYYLCGRGAAPSRDDE